MTNHVVRLYTAAVGLLVLFLAWAAIAARPWAPAPDPRKDPRVVALTARQQQLQQTSVLVKRLVDRRWATYRVELRHRNAQIAAIRTRQRAQARAAAARAAAAPAVSAGPSVRVVTLPPLTVTRTS